MFSHYDFSKAVPQTNERSEAKRQRIIEELKRVLKARIAGKPMYEQSYQNDIARQMEEILYHKVEYTRPYTYELPFTKHGDHDLRPLFVEWCNQTKDEELIDLVKQVRFECRIVDAKRKRNQVVREMESIERQILELQKKMNELEQNHTDLTEIIGD